MHYHSSFKDVVAYCDKTNLFLGFGNPEAKILIIGKEQSYNAIETVGSPAFIQEVLDNRERENIKNIRGWRQNIEELKIPDWDNMPSWNTIIPDEIDPFYNWGSQLNKANINGNGGTSNTYLKYQKLYQYLNGAGKSSNINFLKDMFLSELNDIPTKYSYPDKKLKSIRKESVENRKMLFNKPFFRRFPITIIAAGHYPRDYQFDLEKIFDVKFIKSSLTNGKYWFNIHLSQDEKRILIHTRQLSMGVHDELLQALADECRPFLNFSPS